jgi:hypothetical protein
MYFLFTKQDQRLFKKDLDTKKYLNLVNFEIRTYQFSESNMHANFYQSSISFRIQKLKFKFGL